MKFLVLTTNSLVVKFVPTPIWCYHTLSLDHVSESEPRSCVCHELIVVLDGSPPLESQAESEPRSCVCHELIVAKLDQEEALHPTPLSVRDRHMT